MSAAEHPQPLQAAPYQYVVLRCVPRVDREEFINVAVVVHVPHSDQLAFVWYLDRSRLQALDPALDLTALEASLTALERICAGDTSDDGTTATPSRHREGGVGGPMDRRPGTRFGWLAAPRSTILQPGPVHGGLTDDIQREADRLLTRLVR